MVMSHKRTFIPLIVQNTRPTNHAYKINTTTNKNHEKNNKCKVHHSHIRTAYSSSGVQSINNTRFPPQELLLLWVFLSVSTNFEISSNSKEVARLQKPRICMKMFRGYSFKYISNVVACFVRPLSWETAEEALKLWRGLSVYEKSICLQQVAYN